MSNPFFTIFTPVYNGERHINRVFESISSQTFKDFEWIVINDGSTDNTSILVKSFIDIHPDYDIIYLEQSNSGKHIAWNRAVRLARGKIFIPADADDSFLPDTLSFFYESWNKLTHEEQLTFSGINVLCLDNNTDKIVGTPFPMNGMKTNNLKLEYKYKIQGEKWGCIRTDLLKSRPFPVIKGSYFPEDYIWLYLSKRYNVICFNKALRRYYTTDKGITQTEIKRKVNLKYDLIQSKVKVRYNIWFLSTVGLYVFVHSPKVFFRCVGSTILHLVILLRR